MRWLFFPALYRNIYSVLFDGVDEYLITGAEKKSDSAFTMCTWFKYIYPGSSSQHTVFSLTNRIDVTPDSLLRLYYDDQNKSFGLQYRLNSSSFGLNTFSTFDANDSSWHFLAMTVNGTEVELFIDNVSYGTVSNSNLKPFSSWTDQFIYFGMGTITWSPSQFWTGNFDETSYFSKVLNSSELTEAYNGGVPNNLKFHSASANLINYWRFGDGDGDSTASGGDIIDQVSTFDLSAVNMESGDITTDVP